jgi:hypothetical protein
MRAALIIVSALVLAGCGGDSAAETPRATGPLVVYERGYGGYTGGMAELRVGRDGIATLRGGAPGDGCRNERTSFRLSPAELDRLNGMLTRAGEISPRSASHPAVEAPSYRIATGGVELRYVGFDATPAAAQPLVGELDLLVRNHCLRHRLEQH